MDLGTPEFIGFPEEVPQYCCRLTFKKYERPKPGSPVTSKTDIVIRMPIPATLTDQYNMDINDVQLDILGNAGVVYDGATNALAAGQRLTDDYINKWKGSKNKIDFIKDTALGVLALTPGISDKLPGQAARASIGMVRNPHHTTLFNGVKLKTYGFTWKMSPRSQSEAITLENIVKNIKTYMHPSITSNTGGFALDYPSLVEVQFQVGDNQILPNVKPALISSFSVNGSAGGTPAFYKDGKSTIVELSLSLQEINVQTREDFLGTNTTG